LSVTRLVWLLGNCYTGQAISRIAPINVRVSRGQASSGLRLLMINHDHFERDRVGRAQTCNGLPAYATHHAPHGPVAGLTSSASVISGR
jgi:hypothetical protein